MSEEKGIRLEFAQFGHFDSFEVFRSLTSMIGLADHELPAPIATGLKTMRFIDQINLKTVLDRDLYYRVRVIRGNQSLLSDELQTYISTFNAPQNLTVAYTNGTLEMEWDFESVTEHRYYCSESPININSLPMPKAIIAGNLRTYVDTDVEIGKTYYVRVGSVKNGVEKIGDEIIVAAQDRIYRVQLNVDSSNLLNSYGTLPLTWSQSGVTLIHANNEIQHTSTASFLKSNEVFSWSGAWDIEFDVYIDSTVSNAYKSIVSNKYQQWVLGSTLIFYGDSGAGGYEIGRFGIGNYGANGLMSNVMSKDTWHHVRCIKTADHKYTMYVNDVLQYSNATTNISNRNPSDGVINLGYVTSGISGDGVRIRNFIIH